MNCNPLIFSACQHPQQLLIFGPTGRQVEVDLVLLTSKSHDPASYCRSLSIVYGFFNANGPQSKKISGVHLWFFFSFLGRPLLESSDPLRLQQVSSTLVPPPLACEAHLVLSWEPCCSLAIAGVCDREALVWLSSPVLCSHSPSTLDESCRAPRPANPTPASRGGITRFTWSPRQDRPHVRVAPSAPLWFSPLPVAASGSGRCSLSPSAAPLLFLWPFRAAGRRGPWWAVPRT